MFSTLVSASVGEVFTYIGYVILAILSLMLMIVVHESGHYLAGKIFKFNIDEFSIGFGPAIFKHRNKKNGELFAIRCIPLGGYCAFYGEDEDTANKDEYTDENGTHSLVSEVDEMNKVRKLGFNQQKAWKRLIVLFSGAFFNFLFAIFVISIYFSAYGQYLPIITGVHDAIGQQEVFEAGDVVLRVDSKQVNIMLAEDLNNTFANLGDEVKFSVLRDGEVVKLTAKKAYYTPFGATDRVVSIDGVELDETTLLFGDLGSYLGEDDTAEHVIVVKQTDGGQVSAAVQKTALTDENGVTNVEYYSYGFGITRSITLQKLSYGLALGRSFGFAFFIVFKILASLGALITGKLGAEAVGGTITVVKTMADATQMAGFGYLMYVIAIISANLAVMNLLPLPALDGARMVFTLIEMIFRKPVPRKIEGAIHTVGLILLIVLAVFLDVFHLAST